MRTIDKNMIMAGGIGATMLVPVTTPVGLFAFLLAPLVSGVYLTGDKKVGEKFAHAFAASGLSILMIIIGLSAGMLVHGSDAYESVFDTGTTVESVAIEG